MQTSSRAWLLAWIVLTAPTFGAESPDRTAPVDSLVHVTLRDGRHWLAAVDHRTNDELFWLRFTRGNASLSTAVTWDLVESVQAGNSRHSAAEFRAVAKQFVSRLPAAFGSSAGVSPGDTNASPAWQLGPSPRGPGNVPQSLAIEAQVANWDRDAEMDGIEIRLLPRSAWGTTLPFDGNMTVELLGRNQLATTERGSFPDLGRWSQVVRAADFTAGWGAVYRIPFRQLPPEQDLTLQSWGWVKVSVQGRGIPMLEAQAPVHLRTFNPVRDQWLDQQRNHDSFGRYRARHW